MHLHVKRPRPVLPCQHVASCKKFRGDEWRTPLLLSSQILKRNTRDSPRSSLSTSTLTTTSSMASYPVIRAVLYAALWLFSVIELGLTAARINYTTHLRPPDPLNDGRPFHDPIVAELLVCSILAVIWSPLVIHMIHGRREYRFLSLVWHELLGLLILWLMWLVGAAVATQIWPNLPSFCSQYLACRILTAMVAFAWLGWITITALVVTTLLYATANSSWADPAHGHWGRENPRMSEFSTYSIHA